MLFLFCLENSSSHSIRVDLPVTNCLNSPSSENVLISSPFLPGIGVRVDSYFQHLKKTCHFLLASVVSGEKSTVILIVFPLQERCSFSLTAFKIISLPLVS